MENDENLIIKRTYRIRKKSDEKLKNFKTKSGLKSEGKIIDNLVEKFIPLEEDKKG